MWDNIHSDRYCSKAGVEKGWTVEVNQFASPGSDWQVSYNEGLDGREDWVQASHWTPNRSNTKMLQVRGIPRRDEAFEGLASNGKSTQFGCAKVRRGDGSIMSIMTEA